ncbi:uncharacterized protein LOC144867676 [Branchiostoma floridae x Branchiostoma japonicum]
MFSSPRHSTPGFNPNAGIPGDPAKLQELQDEDFEIPLMTAESDGHLKLLQVIPTDKPDVQEGVPASFKHGSLVIDEPPKRIMKLQDQEEAIVGNLTCMRTVRPKESQERISCFHNIMEALEHLSPDDLTRVANKYITANPSSEEAKENRDAITDALGAMATNDSIYLMTTLVLTPQQRDAKLVLRALFHFFGLEGPAPKIVIDTVENMCFTWRMEFDDDQDGRHVWTRAHLLLGALAGKLHATDPVRAHTIIDRLHGMVEIHDPWKHRQLRSVLTEEEYRRHNHEKATILGALGNAGMDKSYEYLVSHVNNTESPSILKRTSMTALKNYHHEQAAEEILRVALDDPVGHVRYAAALDYLSHPKASKLQTAQRQIDDRYLNQTAIEELREKRGVNDQLNKLFKPFYFKLATPSYDWHKRIGSSNIGASMGLVIRNEMELDLKPLSGRFSVDAFDMAYAKVHIGLINLDLKFLDAKICYKGKAEYDFNVFQEFNFEEVFRLVKLFDGSINKVVNNIKDNIIRFKRLLSRTTGSIDGIFRDMIEAVENLPNQVREFRVKAKVFIRKSGEYTNLPPVVENVKQVVHRVSSLISDIKAEVMEFYHSIADAVTITLPWASKQIETGVRMVVSSIERLIKTPATAIEDIYKGVTLIKFAVAGVLEAKERIEKALLFNEDKTLHWMNLQQDLLKIDDDISVALDSLLELDDWAMQQVEATDITIRFYGVNITVLRQQIVTELRGLMDGLVGSVAEVRRIPVAFLSAYNETVDIIKSIKDGYQAVKNGYDEAKSLVEQIFGNKADQDFPRKYLESPTCGDGFYPSTGGGRYAEQGVLLEAGAGQQIGAPFSGIVRRSGSHQVTITTDAMEKLDVIIGNVDMVPGKEGKRVFKGTLIGTVSSSDCQPNHIHLAIRNTKTGGLVDPTRFMEKRGLVLPSLEVECADYSLIFVPELIMDIGIFDAVSQLDLSPDRLVPDLSDLQVPDFSAGLDQLSNLQVPDFSAGLDLSNLQVPDLSIAFPDLNIGFGQAMDFASNLNLPDLTESVSLLNFDFRSVKLPQVFDFMVSTGLGDAKAQLEQALESVQELFHMEKTSCPVPETLDDAALKRILRDRGHPTTGSRHRLLENYRKPENRCPDLRRHLPQNMHCFFEENCLGVTCCVELDLKFTKQSFGAFARIDPCNYQLTLGLGSWRKTFNITNPFFAEEDVGPVEENLQILDIAQVVFKYVITAIPGGVKVTFQTAVCSSRADLCMPYVSVFSSVRLQLGVCQRTSPVSARQRRGIADLQQLTMGEIERLMDEANMVVDNVTSAIRQLRTLYRNMAMNAIDSALHTVFEDQFSSVDKRLSFAYQFGPYASSFFPRPYIVPFMLGPIPMRFSKCQS